MCACVCMGVRGFVYVCVNVNVCERETEKKGFSALKRLLSRLRLVPMFKDLWLLPGVDLFLYDPQNKSGKDAIIQMTA